MLGGVKVLKATLYVKGVRTVVVKEAISEGYVSDAPYRGATGRWRQGGDAISPSQSPYYEVKKKTAHKSVLSEDQKVLVERVKAAALKYGFELKVVDVGENRFLDKLATRLKRISSFPALVTDRGLKIEEDITEERIKALFVDGTGNQ